VLPIFGALPFVFGAIDGRRRGARYVDAFFEAMSGLTTTGSTAFDGARRAAGGHQPLAGLLQWFGGIGIIVVAMVFLPELRVGGMQIFRSEAFDTMGKILPRATEIAASDLGHLPCAHGRLRADLRRRSGMPGIRRADPCADDHLDGRVFQP
jgi:trk system potassium uptake protein TrkH